LFTLGCNKADKTKTSSTNSNSTATAKKTSSTTVGGTATTTNNANPTLTPGISPTSNNPTRTGPFDGGFSSEEPLIYTLCNEAGGGAAAINLEESTVPSVGGQFFATTSFNYIETGCPSSSDNIGNLTLSIYNWKTDYETTVSGTAIKSKEFVDFKDNEFIRLTFDSPMPAGEYLWVLSNPVQVVGIWSYPEGPIDHPSDVKCYIAGEESVTFHLCKIQYTKTPNITLAELSK